MRSNHAAFALVMVVLLPASAAAYVGPGAGVSLIGATVGLLVALAMAVGFVIVWPVRALLRHRRQPPSSPAQTGPESGTP